MEVDQGPAVEIEKLRPEVAGEPRVAREDHERTDAALAAPPPGDDPAGHEDEADDAVRHDEGKFVRLVRDPFCDEGQGDGAHEERKPQELHAPTRPRARRARGR